ncbi:MAG: glycosyltransferase family 2 protein [Patescibacteria group bacterium]
MKTATIIIPTYNEKENISKIVPVLQEVFKSIKNWNINILVVDDSSPDKTADAVKKLQKKYKNLHLLLNKKKAGLGSAYLKGMARAFGDLKADVAFEFDADFSHDPKKIPELLKKIDEGYDLVLGSRYVKGGSIPDNWGLHRKLLSRVGNLVIMLILTDFRIRDWTAGYRAISKKVYEAVYKEMSSERFSGYTFQIGFLHKTVRKGFKVAEVPINFIDRTIGESKLGAEYIKNTLIYIVKVRIQEIIKNRVFKFAFVGGIGTLVQLLSLIIFRAILPEFSWFFWTKFLLATLMAIEMAIISNFIWNNLWTFSDRKLKTSQIPSKFIQFNLASLGSVLIQLVINSSGEFLIGLHDLFKLPILGFMVDTGLIFAITGIIIGLFWNFFAYSKFIWRKK